MNINQFINISPNFIKIESLLLDFEQFPQTDILVAVYNELKTVIQKMRTFYNLNKILNLLNELSILIAGAAEQILVLNILDIDLILHLIDFISNCCNMEYNKIDEINTLTNDISISYIENIRKLNTKISLQKRTNYIQFKEIKTNGRDNVLQKNDNSLKTNELNIKNKEFVVKEENKNTSSLNDTVEKIYEFEDENLSKLRNKTEESSSKIFDKTAQQFDFFDSYLDNLGQFAGNSQEHKKNDDLADKFTSLNKKINYNDVNYLIDKSINLSNLLNFQTEFQSSVATTLIELEKINTTLKKVYFQSNDFAIRENINNINLSINNINELIENTDKIFSDKLIHANHYVLEIYDKLSDMHSKPFSYFTVGMKEYVDAIANSLRKKVNLVINNINTLISSDLWIIFEYIIPIILRYIIINNLDKFSDKLDYRKNTNQIQKISMSVNINSGIIELIFYDNGRFIETEKQIASLQEIILLVQNAGGKVLLSSTHQKGNIIKFRFQMENSLSSFLIFEVKNQYYAIPSEYCELYNEKDNLLQNTINIFYINDLNHQKRESQNNISNYIKINKFKLLFTINCDNIIGISILAPKRLTGTLSEIPFSIGAAQYGSKTVLLLDLDEIYKHQQTNLIEK